MGPQRIGQEGGRGQTRSKWVPGHLPGSIRRSLSPRIDFSRSRGPKEAPGGRKRRKPPRSGGGPQGPRKQRKPGENLSRTEKNLPEPAKNLPPAGSKRHRDARRAASSSGPRAAGARRPPACPARRRGGAPRAAASAPPGRARCEEARGAVAALPPILPRPLGRFSEAFGGPRRPPVAPQRLPEVLPRPPAALLRSSLDPRSSLDLALVAVLPDPRRSPATSSPSSLDPREAPPALPARPG